MQQSHIPALRDARRAEQAISTEASAALGRGENQLCQGSCPSPWGSPAQNLEVAAVRPPLDGMFPSSHMESDDRTPKTRTTNMGTGLRPLATTCLGATRGGHWGHAGEEGPGELGQPGEVGELSWCFHPSQHGVTAPKGSSLFQGEGTAWMRG